MPTYIPMTCARCKGDILEPTKFWIGEYPYHSDCAELMWSSFPVITEQRVREIVREELARSGAVVVPQRD